MRWSIGVVAASLSLSAAAPARADEPFLKCSKAAPTAKLTVEFKHDASLAELAAWLTSFTCKAVVFDGEAGKRGAKLAMIAPSAMSPRQAIEVFTTTLGKVGLVVAEHADTFVVKLGPSVARPCPDLPPGATAVAPGGPAPQYRCATPATNKLSLTFAPEQSLEMLRAWVAGVSCARVTFDPAIPVQATKVTILVPQYVTPKQALRLFVEAMESAGLVVAETATSLAVKPGPRSPAGCKDAALPPPPVVVQGPPVQPPADPAVDVDADLDAGIRKIDDTHYELKHALVDRTLQDPMAVMKGVRVVPSMVNGKPDGFKLYAVRPRSIFARLGFANGDTVKSLNGVLLHSVDASLDAYVKLRGAPVIEVALTRRGVDLKIFLKLVK